MSATKHTLPLLENKQISEDKANQIFKIATLRLTLPKDEDEGKNHEKLHEQNLDLESLCDRLHHLKTPPTSPSHYGQAAINDNANVNGFETDHNLNIGNDNINETKADECMTNAKPRTLMWETPSSSRRPSITEPLTPRIMSERNDLPNTVKSLAQIPSTSVLSTNAVSSLRNQPGVLPKPNQVPRSVLRQREILLRGMQRQRERESVNNQIIMAMYNADIESQKLTASAQSKGINLPKSDKVEQPQIKHETDQAELIPAGYDALKLKYESEMRLRKVAEKSLEDALAKIRNLEVTIATQNQTIAIQNQTIQNQNARMVVLQQELNNTSNAHKIACTERDSLRSRLPW